MRARSEWNGTDPDEIDLVEVWAKVKPAFLRYKYRILAASAAFMLLGLVLSEIQEPQWEAAAAIRVGRVSSTEPVEPFESLFLRLKGREFQVSVLKKCGISYGSPDAALYRRSVEVKQLKDSGLVSIKVRGRSGESALKLSAATVGEILGIHADSVSRRLSPLESRLAVIEKLNRDIAAISRISGQDPPAGRSLTAITAAYLAYESGQLKITLLSQAGFLRLHPTVLLEQSVGDAPISPRRPLWICGFGLIGFIAALLAVLAVNYRENISGMS